MNNSKSFRFKFNKLTWVLLALVLVICLAGVGYNVYSLINALKRVYYVQKIIITSIILALNVFLVAFVVSVIVFSKYVIKDGCVYNYLGFVRGKSRIDEIIQITHFKKSDKLVVYFNDQRYTVVVISPTEYDEFISIIREINPKVYYTSQIDGEEQP